MVSANKWILSDNVIALEDLDGSITFPSAREVFLSNFTDGGPADNAETPAERPQDALPFLTFSRFPARPAIQLSGAPPDLLRATFGVLVRDSFHLLPPNRDQLIVDGCWYPVDPEIVAEAQRWSASLGIRFGVALSLPELVYIRRIREAPIEIIDVSSASATELAAGQRFPHEALKGLRANLFPYQRDGIAFLSLISNQAAGCVLADEMGLGKTLQVIGLITSEINENRPRNLVVVPASLVENWRRELEAFNPDLRVLIHAGAFRAGIASRLRGWDVVVTSYETAVRDRSLLSSLRWNLLVLDEAQFIKNPEAQRAESIKQIPRRVSIAVTGTPLENRLEDYWSIVDFAVPGMLGDLATFRADFADETHDARRIGTIAEPIILRRLVRDVAQDLPDLIEIPQAIEMSSRLAQSYEEIRRDYADSNRAAKSVGLEVFTALRILCTHPLIKNDLWGRPEDDMPKYQRLLEILEEIFQRNEKVLIFTSFTRMVDLLGADLTSRWKGGFFRSIDGRVPTGQRSPIIDEFEAFQGYGALVLNAQAAGVGLNITAANHVVHYNPEWNPARTDQATRRAYRRRQEKPVTVHHLFYANSVEEAIVTRSAFKRQLADEAVRGHDGTMEPQFLMEALARSPLDVVRSIGRL